MTPKDRQLSSRSDRLFRALLRAFPFDFRTDHEREMAQTFRAQLHEARQEGTVASILRLWVEAIRDAFTTAPREHFAILRQDIEYALRSLRRSPVFASAAVLTLAIGVSAVVAVAAIINAFMFRPLPVERPHELMSVSTRDAHGPVPHGLSFLDLQDYRSHSAVFTDLIGYAPRSGALDAGSGAERITMGMVTDNYFSLLGVQPALGRLIQPKEGQARGDAPVLVLTYSYWQSRFAGDVSIIGRSVRLNARPFTIIGIAPRSFSGTDALVRVAAYVPLWMVDDLANTPGTSLLERRDSHALTVLGRLKPGVSPAQAQSALDIASAGLARQNPATNKGVSLLAVPENRARPNPGLGPFFQSIALVMAGLAGLLLLITSANVSNLLLARAAGRGREVALRAALGARRGRLVRQLLTESIVLATIGGVVAIPVVTLAMRSLEQFIARQTSVASLQPDFGVDVRVLGVTLAVAIVSGVVCGLAPALQTLRADLNSVLKTGGRGTQGASRNRMRGALVVAQVALSMTLLVSGGLFVRSLERARDVDLGFETDNILLASTSLTIGGYDSVKRLSFYRNVHDRVTALPGVESASWISWPPFSVVYQTVNTFPEGQPPGPDGQSPQAFAARVTPDYFVTAGVPVVEGRAFDKRDDADAAPVAIVNQTLARKFWPGQNATGRRLMIGTETLSVVGVVRDGKYNQVWEAPSGFVFRPLLQDVPTSATIVVRTAGAPAETASAVREAMRTADPDVAPYDIRTMRNHLDAGNAFFPFRIGALVTSLFGAMGMLTATIGLYGMIAFQVSQRTQEIGVRMALGGRATDIIRDVLMRGGRLAVAGIAIGVVLAGGLAQVLRTLLLDVSPFDPLTYGAIALLLIVVSLVASFVPARRATVIDPLVALRTE